MNKPHHHRRMQPQKSNDFFRNINIQFLIHEMKGPLDVLETNIRMLLEFQKDYGRLTVPQQQALKRSMRSAAKLRNIIYTLLEVGSSQTGHIKLQQFDVVQCTAEVLVNALETVICKDSDPPRADVDPTEFLAANGMHLIVSPEVQGICLRQDKTKFMCILGNLVRNGLHYKKNRVSVHLALQGPDLQISIMDDGPGIEPEDRKSLFKCYAPKHHGRIRQRGHGLGLASSRILARYLGGDISLEAQHGKGAQFVIRLPLLLDEQKVRKDGYEVCDSD